MTLTFLALRLPLYGSYLIYVLSIFLYYLVRRWRLVASTEFLIPNTIYYGFEGFWSFVISLAYAGFVLKFLGDRIESGSPWIKRLIYFIWYVSAIAILFCLALLILPQGVWWSNVVANVFRVVLILVGVIVAVLLGKSRDLYSLLVAGGILVLVSGLGMILVNEMSKAFFQANLEPDGIGFMQMGILGELTFYLLALLWRQRKITKVNARQAQEIAAIQERTAALENELQEVANPYFSVVLKDGSIRRWARTQVQGFVANGDATRCLLSNGRSELIYLRLGKLEEQLPEFFFRIHRSHIIDVNQVVRLDRGRPSKVYLEGKPEPLPVSGKLVDELVRRMI